MRVIIDSDPKKLAAIAADQIVALYRRKPDAVLGVATGSSPLDIYSELAVRVQAGQLSLAKAKAFQLDEYVGIDVNHPQRYRNFIETYLVKVTDIDTANVFGPDGNAEDLDEACARYEAQIAEAGGIDLQILGVGVDGHIAFNEPGASLGGLTHVETLIHQTISDNARFFDGDESQVPRFALTQGVATILKSRSAVLIATGENKADAIQGIVEGPVTAMCTGSALQWHPDVTILVDEAAASKLAYADRYRELWQLSQSR